MTDVELLNQHRHGSDAAFADLVRRHLGWVYGLARRRLRDAHLAEDVAQAVFVLLHRKAPQFAADGAMISWLHKTAWYVSETAARSERRRRNRETEVALIKQNTVDLSEPTDWQQLAPLLDRLIGQLPRADREAILLRYYRDLPFADIALQIGTSADTARKRVDRAIDKLRRLAANQNVDLSVAALSAHLLNYVRLIPPPGLVATTTVAATAPAGSALAASCGSIVKGAAIMTASTKTTLAVAALTLIVISAGVTVTVWMTATDYPKGATQWSAMGSKPSIPVSTPDPAPPAPGKATPANHAWDANNSYPKLAPFSSVAWHGDVPEVEVNGARYELVEIDGQPVAPMIKFAKQNSTGINWQKHFAEDLVEILSRMGHPPGKTAKLLLRTQETGKPVLLENVPMTEDNRRSAMEFDNTGSHR